MTDPAPSPMLSQLTDEELLRVLARQPRPDPQSRRDIYGEIARRHHAVVLRFIASRVDYQDALDLAQETFIDALRHIDDRGSLETPYKLEAWLLEVARRRVLKFYSRGRPKDRPGPDDATVQEMKDRERIVEAGHDAIRLERVHRLLPEVVGSLDEEQRQLYRLRNESALTGREIAARLGQNAGAVSKKCTYLDQTVAKRFHVLLLIRESSTKCAKLQQLLEDYGRQRDFTAELTDLVIEHYSTCRTCGNCAVCRGVQRQLIWDAAPVAIPIVLAAAFRERIELAVQEVVNATSLPSGLRESPPPPPRPPGPPAPTGPGMRSKSRLRRHAIQTGVVAVAVLGALFAVSSLRSGSNPQTLPPQEQVAASVVSAMTAKEVVAFDINARNNGDPAQFVGQGRIGMTQAGTSTAATHVLYDPGEDPWFPPEVVLINDRAYITSALPDDAGNRPTKTADRASDAKDELSVDNALQTRWLASPAHLSALLKGATRFEQKTAGSGSGRRTLTGSVPLSRLVDDRAGGFFYRPYAQAGTVPAVTFTIVTDGDYLPVTVAFSIPVRRTATPEHLVQVPADPFKITYRDWSKGKPITAPTQQPPPEQWGGTPSPT